MATIEIPLEPRTTPEMLECLASFQENPPVDVLGFADALGIAVWEDDLPQGISGKLFRDETNGGHSGYSIVANASEGYRRKRFTIAHEIAHFMLHRHLITEVVDNALYRSGLTSKQESEANRLAASILMPMRLIERLQNEGVTSVDGLADRLQVSGQAIMVRLGIPLP
jgi:Zn-dependent peptidase ImmA (M78 family)